MSTETEKLLDDTIEELMKEIYQLEKDKAELIEYSEKLLVSLEKFYRIDDKELLNEV